MAPRKIVLLEFNELCPPLLGRWMSEGKLPNFLRFYRGSEVFTAVADELDPDNLEPWIQWYSLHTGLRFSQHGVFHLTDGPAAEHNDIWRMLLKHGLRVANCASMNAKGFRAGGCFYLPDPWCTSEAPYPRELSAYQNIVVNYVQENSTTSKGSLTYKDYVRFLIFLAGHGLSLATLTAIGRQLWSDTVAREGTTWKRAPLLDLLQFDVFRHYWRKSRPDFCTFFLNSTAHYQHGYWHCAFPDEFPVSGDVEQTAKFRDAILYGYQQMDRLLDRFLAMEREGAMLILATALSQHANKRFDKTYYRPVDARKLLVDLGIVGATVMPVMSEQFAAHFNSPGEADAAREKLWGVRLAGEPVFAFAPSPEGTVFFGAKIRSRIAKDATLQGFPGGPRPFWDVFKALPHAKAGVHDPESVLWLKTGNHGVHTQRVSILDILPTILEYFGIDRASVDQEGRLQGSSLLPVIRDTKLAAVAS